MNKRLKKLFCLVLSLVMVMGLGMSANAATITSTTQDSTVMLMESSTATVSYNATTVEGDGTAVNPDVTRYSYYLMMPEGGSIASVPVTVTLKGAYSVLKIDGQTMTTTGSYTGTLDFTGGTKTFVASNASGSRTREFQVTAGVSGSDLKPVYVRVDVKNAVDWVAQNPGSAKVPTVEAQMAAITGVVPAAYAISDNGIMTAFVEVQVKAGDTAMDALQAACEELNLTTKGSSAYVSGIGSNGTFLSEFSTTNMSGWMYLDRAPGAAKFTAANYGAASYNLAGGEYFTWIFVNGWSNDQLDYVNQ